MTGHLFAVGASRTTIPNIATLSYTSSISQNDIGNPIPPLDPAYANPTTCIIPTQDYLRPTLLEPFVITQASPYIHIQIIYIYQLQLCYMLTCKVGAHTSDPFKEAKGLHLYIYIYTYLFTSIYIDTYVDTNTYIHRICLYSCIYFYM